MSTNAHDSDRELRLLARDAARHVAGAGKRWEDVVRWLVDLTEDADRSRRSRFLDLVARELLDLDQGAVGGGAAARLFMASFDAAQK